LPPELNLHILTFLNAKDLATVALVNRELYRFASDEVLWKRLCDRRWRARSAGATERDTVSPLSLSAPVPSTSGDADDSERVRCLPQLLILPLLPPIFLLLYSLSPHPGEEASQAELEGRVRVQDAGGRQLAHRRLLARAHAGGARLAGVLLPVRRREDRLRLL
jgi:hypothetical protein